MDVLCADKTGTFTRNELVVTSVHPMEGVDEAHVLALAALASSEGGQDPVDTAIRTAAYKRSEATFLDSTGATRRVVKGAVSAALKLAPFSVTASAAAKELEVKGFRILAVAEGMTTAMRLVGLIALSDPPREDSSVLVTALRALGVRTVMVSGDAAATAAIVAHAVWLEGAVCPPGAIPIDVRPEQFAVFAGVLPEDKYTLVKAFQTRGHTVGMCGDGANDAPALRQAQIGIAVSTATDVVRQRVLKGEPEPIASTPEVASTAEMGCLRTVSTYPQKRQRI